MPMEVFKDLEIVIKQIDIVLNAIIPSIRLEITNQKKQFLKNVEDGINFEIVSISNNKLIPLKYESRY